MGVQVRSILAENITIVYDRLDLHAVDASKLKALTETHAVIMDTPELIVAVFPASPLIVQLGDRRVRITHQGEHEALGALPLWEIAAKCHQAVPQECKVVAYGYNYDVLASTGDVAASDALKMAFLRDQQAFEEAAGGTLRSFAPRFVYDQDAVCDLTLEPHDANRIKVHMNVHFTADSLPATGQLQESYFARFERLVAVLQRLLKGGD